MNAKQPDSHRLFFALWPDDATATALRQLQTDMHGRLTSYGNLHVTLVFVGQQPIALLPELKDVLAHLPRSDIRLRLDHVGYFRRNRIAWAGARDVPEPLLALHGNLVDALRKHKVDFKVEHEFKPHITLARDASIPADMTFEPIVWHANRVALVKSVTTAEGSTYQMVAERDIAKEARVPDEARQEDIDAP